MKILQYWTKGSAQVPARGGFDNSSGKEAQEVPWEDFNGPTERQEPLLIQFRREGGQMNKKIKSIYLLLIAIVGVFAIVGGCSSDSDDDSNGGGNVGAGAVDLGSAGNFVILAKSAITNTPTSAITGDIGLSPAAESFITGLALTRDASDQWSTSAQVTGKVYASDLAVPTPANMTAAISDMETAYTDAAGRTLPDETELGAGEIGGLVLAPGLYKWGTGVSITTDVTLSGSGHWIFQIGQGLTVASAARVILAGGAVPANIVWQVAGAATLGTTSHVEGIVMSQTAITLGTGATVNGRLFAQSAVTLDGNTIVQP